MVSSAAVIGAAAASMSTRVGDEPVAGPIAVAGSVAAVRSAQGDPSRAVTGLGTGPVKDTGLRMSSSGFTAKCASTAGRALRSSAGPVTGKRVGRLPIDPPADYHVPVHDPNVVLMMSKQVSDPFGGMTLSGVSVDSTPGMPRAVRSFAVARCESLRRTGAVRPVSAVTRGKDRGDLAAAVTSLGSAAGALAPAPAGRPARLLGGLPHLG